MADELEVKGERANDLHFGAIFNNSQSAVFSVYLLTLIAKIYLPPHSKRTEILEDIGEAITDTDDRVTRNTRNIQVVSNKASTCGKFF